MNVTNNDGISSILADGIIKKPSTDVKPFNPDDFKNRQAKLDALTDYAKRVKDWPLLREAIEAKIEDQDRFVEWWNTHVTPNRGRDRRSENQGCSTATLISAHEAEEKTQITKEKVARWRKYLQDRTAYRRRLTGAAYRAAWLEDRAFFSSTARQILRGFIKRSLSPLLFVSPVVELNLLMPYRAKRCQPTGRRFATTGKMPDGFPKYSATLVLSDECEE